MNELENIVSLSKGQNVSLTKTAPLAKKLLVKLLWQARKTDGEDFDLDASVFGLNEAGKVQTVKDFVFYGNPESPTGAIKHDGDERSGGGECVRVDLDLVPAYIKKMVFVVTIDEAETRRQTFGQVDGASIVLADGSTENGKSLYRFDLTEDSSTETSMMFAELYRSGEEWKFKAVGQGHKGGLAEFCRQYGLNPTK